MKYAFATLLLLFASTAAAQKIPQPAPEQSPRAERTFRGGLGLLVGSSGFGAAFDLSLDAQRRVYRLRLTGHDNSIASWQSAVESVSIAETAVMLGRGRRFTRNYGTLSAGIALVEVSRGADDEGTATVGLPVEAQLISGGPLRLGATLAGNLNPERSFASFILSVQIGRVPAR